MPTVSAKLEKRAQKLCDQLTLEEKVRMLSGSRSFYSFILGDPGQVESKGEASAAEVPRLKLKGYVYSDGPRGITKGNCTAELHRAVRTVRHGKRYLSDQGENAVDLQLLANRSEKTPVGSLSNRELQVLCLIARGYKSSKISAELGLSTKTIETYRSRLMQKLCLHSDADICRFAYDNKLVGAAAPATPVPKVPDSG